MLYQVWVCDSSHAVHVLLSCIIIVTIYFAVLDIKMVQLTWEDNQHRLRNFLLMVATIVYLQGLLHYNTRTKYLPKAPLTNFRANLEETSGPGYKTL